MPIERAIEKRDNFFSIELKEGEVCTLRVGEGDGSDAIVFVVPFDCHLNSYIKRDAQPITYQ